jgi:hypothetical protein
MYHGLWQLTELDLTGQDRRPLNDQNISRRTLEGAILGHSGHTINFESADVRGCGVCVAASVSSNKPHHHSHCRGSSPMTRPVAETRLTHSQSHSSWSHSSVAL